MFIFIGVVGAGDLLWSLLQVPKKTQAAITALTAKGNVAITPGDLAKAIEALADLINALARVPLWLASTFIGVGMIVLAFKLL